MEGLEDEEEDDEGDDEVVFSDEHSLDSAWESEEGERRGAWFGRVREVHTSGLVH